MIHNLTGSLEMKKIAAIILALALSPSISSAAQEAAATTAATSVHAAVGRVYVVSGSVFVAQGKSPARWVTGSEAIVSGMMVNTGDKSAALLKFEDGQVVTMQANSAFHVRDYRYDARRIENSNIVFSMFKGGMLFITGLIGQQRKQAFRLLTPNATIGIRGTEFMVAMADNSLYSQVLAGDIGMTNAAGTTVLGAGQTAVVASSGALASLIPASAIPAGTFGELLSIPVDPSAIPSPATGSASAPDPGGAATSAAGATAGASAAAVGASIGVAGGVLAGMVGGDSDSTPSDSPTTSPAADPDESTEPAKAADNEEMGKDSKSGIGLTARIGTLGYGAELNFGSSDSFSARIGLNAYTYKYNATSSEVNYDFKLQLQTVSALADWYPFAGRFRTSGGLFYNNNKATLNAVPGAGGYTINGVPYTSAQVGSMQGSLAFNKAAPYIGIGWGNPVAKDKGWGMTSDFGVLLQGSPKTSLVVTCGTLTAPDCATLQANADAENAQLQNDLSNFKFWPVVSIGISYQW